MKSSTKRTVGLVNKASGFLRAVSLTCTIGAAALGISQVGGTPSNVNPNAFGPLFMLQGNGHGFSQPPALSQGTEYEANMFSLGQFGAAPDFANPSFETPKLPANTWDAPPPPGTSWTWTYSPGQNSCGIENGSSSWGTNAHAGSQFAFAQDGSSISQTISGLRIGQTYQVSFWTAARNGDVGGNDPCPLTVTANGAVIVQTFSPPGGGAWFQYTSNTFTATSTTYTFVFQTSSSMYDSTDLLDDIHLLPATVSPPTQQFVNPSFETPQIPAGSWDAPPPPNTSWTWTFTPGQNSCGIENGASSWGTAAHSGSQFAFAQAGSSISQTLTGLKVGETYQVTFWTAARSGDVGANDPCPMTVTANGATIVPTFTPPSGGAWYQYTSSKFTANSKSYSFVFQTISPGYDSTDLFDDIHLADLGPTPPPELTLRRP